MKARRNQGIKENFMKISKLKRRKGFRKAGESAFHLKGTILYDRNKRESLKLTREGDVLKELILLT